MAEYNDNLNSRGLKALGWEFFGKAIAQGTVFLASIFLARLLSPDDFGLIAMAMVFIGLSQIFIDAGLSSALIQKSDAKQLHYSSVFYFNTFVGIGLAVAVFALAGWIGEFFESTELPSFLRALSILFILNALNSVQITRQRKRLNYGFLAKIDIVSSVSGGIAGISAALLGAGAWALVVQLLSMSVVATTLYWTFGKWIPTGRYSLKALSQLWSFGFRIFLSALLDAMFSRLDFLIIGKIFTPATLGYFERAKTTNLVLVQNSSSTLMNVMFPVLSQIQHDIPRLRKLVEVSLNVLCYPVFLFVGALFLVSHELIEILFGLQWIASANYFEILVISGFGYPIGALLMNVLASMGRSKILLRLEIFKKAILSVALLILVLLGIEAFLYSLVASSAIGLTINILVVSRILSIKIQSLYFPLLTQSAIAVICVALTLLFAVRLDSPALIMLTLTKIVVFTFMYFAISAVLRTSSATALYEQLRKLKCWKSYNKGQSS